MRKITIGAFIITAFLLTGCGQTAEGGISKAYQRSSEIPPAAVADAAVTEAEDVEVTSVKVTEAVTTSVSAENTTTEAKSEKLTEKPTETKPSETSPAEAETEVQITQVIEETEYEIVEETREAEITVQTTETTTESVTEAPEEKYDSFFGVLIDEDCSDFEDPPMHDLPCMFMEGCRASGYGLDIEQPDGTWVFYMFDEKGQELAWAYLNQTTRQDGLFVTVTGRWEDNILKVISIEES